MSLSVYWTGASAPSASTSTSTRLSIGADLGTDYYTAPLTTHTSVEGWGISMAGMAYGTKLFADTPMTAYFNTQSNATLIVNTAVWNNITGVF
jgi:hypothetical protein